MGRLIASFTSMLGFLIIAGQSYAISLCPRNVSGAAFSALCPTGPSGLEIGRAIGNAITFIYVIAIILALFYLIWGGLKWLTSAGDKTALQGAREHIIAAIVGLIIIFLSYLILNVVARFFIPNFNIANFTFPSINQ